MLSAVISPLTNDNCNPWFFNHSLVFHSPEQIMQFQVTQIEFDFEDSLYPMSDEEYAEVYDDYVGTFWEADDGDDLVEEITSAAGWCIKSIDYRIALK